MTQAPRVMTLPGGSVLTVDADPWRPDAFEVLIDGSPQSHVDLGDPRSLAYDYTARIGVMVDAVAPPGAPVRVLHLGAGALTLARYVAITRPGSEQHVVDVLDGLVPAVLGILPFPAGRRPSTVHTGDAAAVVERMRGRAFDVAILDLYSGTRTPAHLTVPAFHAAVVAALAPDGVVIANVADDAGHPALDRTRASLAVAVEATGAVATARFASGEEAGNAVLLGGLAARIRPLLEAALAGGPHPSAVVPA